ncbi:flagellar filament capping protein FliD [Alteraurantiacibacter aquimixticola]|uniref:Flagellar hook-associated protein 2 n=1 Tax=Alteraurantiacibacter aquimixticola TaxID=2489173 RepID=A0A4T3F436_9SPHN|nr:flagellar filament capping protein FliD [Alteraurantiacibacter aquimixticola]TIX51541.1 flagellar hook protein [Alteraurantiacibacter aquimixticola]
MESTTTSSIISALGGGSGVDMTKLANDLAEARFLSQVSQLESRSELLEARISAASTLKNQLSQLASALGDRIRNGNLAPSATIGNGSVAQVSVLAGGSGTGTYSLEVNQLAASQTLASQSYGASTDLVGEGELTIRFGSVSGGSFTEDTERTAAVISVSATDTLADVADKIRTSGSGLNAYVANTANGPQLVVKGATGEANGFVIEASGASAAAVPGTAAPGNIDYLAWDPSTDSGQLKASAQNAAYLFDGVAMTSAGNKVTGLPAGLVLSLTGTNSGAPTQIGFADKSSEITTMMGDFVAALNDISSSLAELGNPEGGELGNDPGARALRRALASLSTQVVMPNAGPGEPSTLADLGLKRTREGNFEFDGDRLRQTLADQPAATSAMFTTGLFGVFATVDSFARNVGSRTDPGSLGGSITRYSSQLERMDDRLAKIAEQQESLRERLVTNFTAADRRVAQSQSTLEFLKNQVAIWTANRN